MIVGMAVNGSLSLLIAEFCGRAHQDAMEAMAALAAIGADDHAHGERGAPCLSEHNSLEMRSGNMGTTRSGDID